ncbi:tripartite tricarboxylate transporter TctB family protein [Falsiroseomonas sp.]|uniref:tripartite tricarboxylate transporter TctB family protein n=1 Tax=Falsiroseomonas sp. TaxID=2870721 RepID=UPI0034A4AB01
MNDGMGTREKMARQAQRGAALVFAALSVGFLWQAREYPYLDDTGPGAGFFAIWIGGLGLLVGIGMLLWPQWAEASVEQTDASPGAARAIAVTLVALAAAGLALEAAGFRLTSFVLLAVLLRTYGTTWPRALLFAATMSFLVFALFDALHLRLPVGELGF